MVINSFSYEFNDHFPIIEPLYVNLALIFKVF